MDESPVPARCPPHDRCTRRRCTPALTTLTRGSLGVDVIAELHHQWPDPGQDHVRSSRHAALFHFSFFGAPLTMLVGRASSVAQRRSIASYEGELQAVRTASSRNIASRPVEDVLVAKPDPLLPGNLLATRRGLSDSPSATAGRRLPRAGRRCSRASRVAGRTTIPWNAPPSMLTGQGNGPSSCRSAKCPSCSQPSISELMLSRPSRWM